ncbi:MAG TPA: family 43 glycosylhydrolase [Acidimicrobiales bacterium]|nr:family 43 glycosylhydrolase [Acidimicrobiales bacterium]
MTLAFVVFCADSVGEEERRPAERLTRAVLWMVTLDGRWYVYFSASERRAGRHRNCALVADHPLGPYTELGPFADPAHDVWAIDLTVFSRDGALYAVWSGWEGPDDGFPQNLYVAPMANPWTISGERRCLSRPQHGWEMSVAAVNEGPEVVRHPICGRLFVLYAPAASWTQAYKMGLLEWTGGDVTDPSSWRKLPRPWFTAAATAPWSRPRRGPTSSTTASSAPTPGGPIGRSAGHRSRGTPATRSSAPAGRWVWHRRPGSARASPAWPAPPDRRTAWTGWPDRSAVAGRSAGAQSLPAARP